MNYLVSILHTTSNQNDQQCIQINIIEGRQKRKFEENENISNAKIDEIPSTNELKQVISIEEIIDLI